MGPLPPPCFGTRRLEPLPGDVIVRTPARWYVLRVESAMPPHIGDGCWKLGDFYFFRSRASVARVLSEDVLAAPVKPGTRVSVEWVQ